MSEKLEFASADWVSAMRSIIEGKLGEGKVDLTGIAYSFCEEFTDPPEHLRVGGSKSIGWYFRIGDGRVEVGQGVLDDADVKIVADYATVLPLARTVFADDPQAAAQAAKLMEEAAASGKIRREGDATAAAAIPALATIHDDIARLTA